MVIYIFKRVLNTQQHHKIHSPSNEEEKNNSSQAFPLFLAHKSLLAQKVLWVRAFQRGLQSEEGACQCSNYVDQLEVGDWGHNLKEQKFIRLGIGFQRYVSSYLFAWFYSFYATKMEGVWFFCFQCMLMMILCFTVWIFMHQTQWNLIVASAPPFSLYNCKV